VIPRTGPDTEGTGKILSLCRGSNHGRAVRSPQSDTILTELSRLVDALKFCTERFGCFLPSALWADPSAVVHTVTDNSNPPRSLPVFDPIAIPASGFVQVFWTAGAHAT
jgi:hypothetical protein